MEPKRMLPRIATAVGIALVLFAGLQVVGTVVGNRVFMKDKGVPTLPKLSSFTSLSFPPDTRVVHGYYEGWQDYNFFSVLEFDPKHTDSFLSGITNGASESRTVRMSHKDRFEAVDESAHSFENKNLTWWTPDSTAKFVAVEIQEGEIYIYVLVDLGSKTRKVYLYAYNI